MRVSDAFPSNYLKAADLRDKNVPVVIERVAMEDIGGDHKPVVYFQGHERGLVLNKTNANNIAVAYGDDTDDWTGTEIILFPAMVDFQGRTVAAIRVRVPPRRPAVQRQESPNIPRTPGITSGPQNGRQINERNPPPTDDVPF